MDTGLRRARSAAFAAQGAWPVAGSDVSFGAVVVRPNDEEDVSAL